MGQPKSWLIFESKSLLENTLHHLKTSGCCPLAVAANRQVPLPNLGDNKEKFILSLDNELYSGPLAGIESGLRCLAPWSDWAVVVPCDLPRLTAQAVAALMDYAFAVPAPCPTVIRQGSRANPLLGVFPTSWHQKAHHLLNQGVARADGLLQGETLRYFEVSDQDWVWRDCDTPEEWMSLQKAKSPQAT